MKRQREDKRTRRDRETIIKDTEKEQNREDWAPEAREEKMAAQREFALLFVFQLWLQAGTPCTKLTFFRFSSVTSLSLENFYQRNKICISTSPTLLKNFFSFFTLATISLTSRHQTLSPTRTTPTPSKKSEREKGLLL